MMISKILCRKCGQTKEVGHAARDGPPYECSDCRIAEEQKEKNDFLAERAKGTIDDRLQWIESEIYEMKKNGHDPFGNIMG